MLDRFWQCSWDIYSISSGSVVECDLCLSSLIDDCGAFPVPCGMFSFTVGTLVCICVVLDNAVFRFVATSAAIAASCGVSTVDCHMSKGIALEALGRLSVALEELAVVGLVAPVDLLSDQLICVFRFANTDKKWSSCSVACQGLLLKRGSKDLHSGFLQPGIGFVQLSNRAG